ncbi:hypothetical protein [Parasulfitobacter algicola]|nr:hypothetical protein [Sulfitobacter algicola]
MQSVDAHTSVTISRIAAIVPALAQGKLRPLLSETSWTDIDQSPRMCRILASHIVSCLDLHQISDGVLTLLQHGTPRLQRAVNFAGAALCASYLRRLIQKSDIEAIISDIGTQAHSFAMSYDRAPTGLIDCKINTAIIRHIGLSAFASWRTRISKAEDRLIRLAFPEYDDAFALPPAAADVFELAMGASDA